MRLTPPGHSKISILLTDDHQMLLDMWELLLSKDERFHVCGQSRDGNQVVEMARLIRPNIILMDINLPGQNGFEATKQIRKYSPGSRIIGLSGYRLPAYVKKLVSAGARGYVTKTSPFEEVIHAIIEINKGGFYICQEIKGQLYETEPEKELRGNPSSLSKREIEVIQLVKEGKTSREIGQHLGISLRTTEVHRNRIFKKLNIKNMAGLLNFTHTNGL
ncbi:MAG: response regulator transcription factor [Bacteroidota bacterium]